jgi:predicted RNase H-like HicB family nuclease
MIRKYLVVFEAGKTSFGAFAPDIPGCISVGDSIDEARKMFVEAAESHLALLSQDGESVPEPSTTSVDFANDPGDENGSAYYVVEWLPISIPVGHPRAVSA